MQGRSRLVRGLWAAGGIISFGLGAVGSVLPILPTTPFILLAAFCFARSSDRLNDWFKRTALYEKVLEGLVTKRQMTVRAKLSIIVPVTILMAVGFALMGRVPVGRIVLAVVWAAHVVYFGFIVRTDHGDAGHGKAGGEAGGAGQASADGEAEGAGRAPAKRRSKVPLPFVKPELFGLLADARKYVWMQVGWKLLALASQIAIALAAARLVQLAFDGALGPQVLGVAAGVIAAGIAVRAAADRGDAHAAYLASVDVKRILRGKVYGKLLRLGSSYRESAATSKVVQLAVEGVEQLETYFSLFLSQLAYAFLAPLALFFVLGPLVSWKVAAVLLVFVPLIPVSIAVVQTVAKRMLSKYWGSYTKLGDTFLENLQGLTTLKVYQADGQAAEQMDRDAEDFRIATMNVLKMQLNSTSVMDIGAYGGAAAGMIMALVELGSGAIGIGGAVAVMLLAAEFFLPMRRLGSYFHVGMNGMAASDGIFELLGLPEPGAAGGRELEGGGVALSLDGVTFSYDGRRNVLEDVSMHVPAGALVSVVGPSGCGKSTVAGLLMGRYRGYGGSVAVNGMAPSDIAEESLMGNVTYVSRASHVFKGTVRDNLAMGCPAADDARLLSALEDVRLADFVRAQGGLDMPVDEGGANLSGGQRQRLALARALLHDTPAYIFDEATSSVDAESEALIMGVVRALAQERTVLLISHRLANVVSSDAIYMMQDGRVVESGTHEQLMAQGGAYARLYGKQAELERYAAAGAGRADGPSAADGEAGPVRADAPGGSASASAPGTRRSALSIMGRLIALVRSMTPVMCLAIALGTLGFLCAILITVLAGVGAVGAVSGGLPDAGGFARLAAANMPALFAVLAILAVARGLLHYGEQYCNHYIAFKMLAIVRRRVFAKLRTLAPAKLEGRDKGDLVSLITGDIELLEVFYAHTVSPIAIAVLVCMAMASLQFAQHWVAGAIACAAYAAVGVALPVWNGRRMGDSGIRQRNGVAELNAYVLDSLYGLDETIQYGDGRSRAAGLDGRSRALADAAGDLNRMQRGQVAATDVLVQLFSWGMLFAMLALWSAGAVGLGQAVVSTLAMAGSFGPVIALSNLSTTLAGTLASGQRVLDLLDEEPVTPDVEGADPAAFGDVRLRGVSFAYGGEEVLSDCDLEVPTGKVVGVHGPSGSGKSTVCKLIMRFWDVQSGSVSVGGRDVRGVNTADLRAMESFMTQETWLFHRSIADNIGVGKPGAPLAEIAAAAEKASLAEFVASLPDGYDTMVGELGDTLSDGERQRIGLARAFLHDAPLMLLDEPTSNLDSLNEAVILRSIAEMEGGKTVVLVSHRASTMALADAVVEMGSRRAS